MNAEQYKYYHVFSARFPPPEKKNTFILNMIHNNNFCPGNSFHHSAHYWCASATTCQHIPRSHASHTAVNRVDFCYFLSLAREPTSRKRDTPTSVTAEKAQGASRAFLCLRSACADASNRMNESQNPKPRLHICDVFKRFHHIRVVLDLVQLCAERTCIPMFWRLYRSLFGRSWNIWWRRSTITSNVSRLRVLRVHLSFPSIASPRTMQSIFICPFVVSLFIISMLHYTAFHAPHVSHK